MTIANKREQIWQSLNDYEYRHQFIGEEINVGIAFQIRSLRNRQKKLKQDELARLMNVKQPLVSSWENPNYGKYTLGTLKGLAKAFDVGLLVRFVPFSKLADWAANLTHDDIAPPSFDEEQSHRAVMTIVDKILNDANQAYSPTSGLDANLAHQLVESGVPSHA